MAIRLRPVLKKLLKITLRVFGIVVLLLVAIILLLQLPAVQTNLAQVAVKYITKRTHTTISIKKIRIGFSGSIGLEGFYANDLKGDTLLSAEELNAGISFASLLHHQLKVNSLLLSGVSLHLSRGEADSLFNYNFLVTTFSSPHPEKDTMSSGKGFSVQTKELHLTNIHMVYDDKYSGLYAGISLKQLDLFMNGMDLKRLEFDISDLAVNGLDARIRTGATGRSVGSESHKVNDPHISGGHVSLHDLLFRYNNLPSDERLFVYVGSLDVKKPEVDLGHRRVALKSLQLEQSIFNFNAGNPLLIQEKNPVVVRDPGNEWRITASDLELKNNRFAYQANARKRSTGFDPAHLLFSGVSLRAKDAFYSSDSMSVKLLSAGASDSTHFTLRNARADFVMTRQSINAKGLEIVTAHSAIKASAELRFSSLRSLRDSLKELRVNSEFKNAKVAAGDVLYFSPGLLSMPFFNTPSNYVTLSGTLKGSVGALHGRNIRLRSGKATEVKTNFVITGLPAIHTTVFDVPELLVTSGHDDLETLLGKSVIPAALSMPAEINLKAAFKGTLKTFAGQASVKSDFGNIEATVDMNAGQSFSGELNTDRFDMGKLFRKQQLLGPATLNAKVSGNGPAVETMTANLLLSAEEIYLNGYNYHALTAKGTYVSKVIDGTVKLQDEYVSFDLRGLMNLNEGSERLKFDLDLKGADLKKLNLNKEDLRVGLKASADLKGKDLSTLNGTAGITGLVITHDGKTFLLDSLFAAAVNQEGKNELNFKSAVATLKYHGDLEPSRLAAALKKHIAAYFPVGNETDLSVQSPPAHFEFELELNDHPLLSDVFLPKLREFSGLHAKGSFNSSEKRLTLNADLKNIVYGGIAVNDFQLAVGSDASALTYSLSVAKLSGTQVNVDHLTVLGKMADHKAGLVVSSVDSAGRKKLWAKPLIVREQNRYKLSLDPQLYLMDQQWIVAGDNYVLFGKEGFLIHDLAVSRAGSRIRINSPADKFKDDIDISITDFSLEDLSGIVERDTSLVKGIVNGDVQLKRSHSTYGLIADLRITNLKIRDLPMGDLALKADQSKSETFSFGLSLKGSGNNVSGAGSLNTLQGRQDADFTLKLEPLSLKAAEAVSFGQITGASGNLEGAIHVKGELKDPEINGAVSFRDAALNPHFTNSPLGFANETITIKGRTLSFNGFTISDANKHKAVINGTVDLKRFSDPAFALSLATNDFMLMNSTSENNREVFGRLILDSKISLKGSAASPVVNSNVTIKKGTNFTFAVPESKLTTDRGEGVVVFEDSLKLSPILIRNGTTGQQKSNVRGMDVSSVIHIEKKAILKLLPDPSGSDSLVAQGDANLSLVIDPSGKISLTGLYELKGGNYQVSLENVVKKQFRITEGSTISWNGDPLDAEVNIRAVYTVRTSPIDLVADQVSGLSESDKNGYKQRFPFLVYLKLRGPILKPEISFEIELPDADKGVLGGSVNTRLAQLNEDPSALNKQAFALLVLGRFVQENPLQSGSAGGAENAVRATVGKFLTAQLNQLSSKLVPGVELNFDVQSYDANVSGGSTAVAIGVKKQLFNEKVSVQVGGTVDVEGEKARQNNASDITGDVLMEYKVTDDGRYRLKGFRRNQYEGAIEGQVLETGGGVLYVRDFDKWDELLKGSKKNVQDKNLKK